MWAQGTWRAGTWRAGTWAGWGVPVPIWQATQTSKVLAEARRIERGYEGRVWGVPQEFRKVNVPKEFRGVATVTETRLSSVPGSVLSIARTLAEQRYYEVSKELRKGLVSVEHRGYDVIFEDRRYRVAQESRLANVS